MCILRTMLLLLGSLLLGVVADPQAKEPNSISAPSSFSEQEPATLIVYNRDYVSKIRFLGEWATDQTLHGVRRRPAGGQEWFVLFVDESAQSEVLIAIPSFGEVLVGDLAVILNLVNQDSVPQGFGGKEVAGGRGSASTTIYNWNHVIKFTTSGTCWDAIASESNCTVQRCKPEGGTGDCKFIVRTTEDCTEHTCECNSAGTLNGWALCRADGTLSTDCPGKTIDCP